MIPLRFAIFPDPPMNGAGLSSSRACEYNGAMRSIVILIGAAIVAAFAPSVMQQNAHTQKATLGTWGVDLSGMDTSVKPGDDFFDYANGTWYKNAVIPADRTSTGSFPGLTILSEQRMTAIVKEL